MAAKDIIKHQFKKGESGNTKGRPPKLVSHITAQLKKEGYDPVTKAAVLDAFQTIVQLPTDQVKEIADPNKKKDYPLLYKLVAQELGGVRGAEMLEKLLDRALGKAAQETKISGNLAVEFSDLTDEQIEAQIEKTAKNVQK